MLIGFVGSYVGDRLLGKKLMSSLVRDACGSRDYVIVGVAAVSAEAVAIVERGGMVTNMVR